MIKLKLTNNNYDTMSSLYPKIGAHLSTAGDLTQTPLRAHDAGCECFQFFSRSPQGGPAKPLTTEIINEFKNNCQKFNLESYVHAPYYINLASSDNRIYYNSIKVIREELDRVSPLGVKSLMAHLGSAKDLKPQSALKKIIDGLVLILKDYQGKTEFLIEISAGAGAVVGDSFEEIASIINSTKLKKYPIGICFDTAHAFASGYDLRDQKTVKETFADFDRQIGLKKLKLIHANDSLAPFNSHKDRHAHIGAGEIGLAGFSALVKIAQQLKINMILETPHHDHQDPALLKDIETLKKLRTAK